MGKKKASGSYSKPDSSVKKKKKKDSWKAVNENSQSLSFPSNLLLQKETQKQSPLSVKTLHPGAVFAASRFLSREECQAWISMAESSGQMEHVAHPATRHIAHRECGRWQRTDTDLADRLFDRIERKILPQVVPQLDFPSNYHPVACNSNLRLYKYEKGMSFGKHFDGSDAAEQGQTEITVLVYLSSCVGGSTRFYPPKASKGSFAFEPEQGAILLHIHGDRCLLHEADAVLDGVKYVLRTDIVYMKS